MRTLLSLFAAGVLAGLTCLVDALLPGGPHFPVVVPIVVVVTGVLLALGTTVAILEVGVGPSRRQQKLRPSWRAR